jgi:hypothetical protein
MTTLKAASKQPGTPVDRDIATRATAAFTLLALPKRGYAANLRKIEVPPGWDGKHTQVHALRAYYLGVVAKANNIEPDDVLMAYAEAIAGGKPSCFTQNRSNFDESIFTSRDGKQMSGLELRNLSRAAKKEADNSVQVNHAVAKLILQRNGYGSSII